MSRDAPAGRNSSPSPAAPGSSVVSLRYEAEATWLTENAAPGVQQHRRAAEAGRVDRRREDRATELRGVGSDGVGVIDAQVDVPVLG